MVLLFMGFYGLVQLVPLLFNSSPVIPPETLTFIYLFSCYLFSGCVVLFLDFRLNLFALFITILNVVLQNLRRKEKWMLYIRYFSVCL